MKNLLSLVFTIALLVGFSSYSFAQKGTLKGRVTDELGSLPGATVLIVEKGTGTTTDFDGFYTLEIAPGTYTVRVSFVGYNTEEQSVTVEAGKETMADFQLNQGINVDEVVVLGTRSAPRTQLETAVPVDVISAMEIQHTGQDNVGQILQYLAPSFHSTHQTISDGTDHIDPATLRGLGPDQVLVLINGKRRHTSSLINVNGTVGRGTVGTDLNSIPASAIERIEILRDGAAAQYGSDAIAGVINIVLKETTDFVSFTARVGQNYPNLFNGPQRARGNVPEDYIPEFNNDGEVYQIGTNFGFDIGDKGGFINMTAELTERGSTNRSGNYQGSPYPDGYMLPPDYNRIPSENDFYDHVHSVTTFVEKQVMEIGNSYMRNAGVFLNAAMPLRGGAEFYANAGFNYRNGIAHGFYRFPSSQARVVPQLYPHGFSPEIHSDIMDNSFTLGLRGEIGGWNADLSQTRGQNSFDFTIKNSNNASLGTKSPTSAYAGGFSYSQNTTNLDFTRSFDVGIPLNVAFGGEFRLENYQIFPGEEASYVNGGVENLWIINGDSTYVAGSAGIQVFPGFQPQNALNKNRNNAALYVDLEADLTDAWLVGLAGRFEDYSDFGSNFSWKLATRYKITEDLSLRGAYSTGFRAPSLHQLYFNNLSTQFVTIGTDLVPVQVGTFNNESTVTKAFGIEPLQPEISNNISFGLAGRIAENMSLTLDAYHISIEDRIVLSGRFSSGYENILQPLGAGAAQFFTNAVSTTTKGLDVVFTYRPHLANGRLNLTLAGNFNETKVDRDGSGNPIIKTSDVLKGQESTLFNREEVSRLEVAQPKSKVLLSALYEVGKMSFMLRATRFGEIEYIHPSDGDPGNWPVNSFTGETESRDQVFDPKIVPDFEWTYSASHHMKFTLGVNNFTNTYPDMHQHSGNVSSGRFLFSRRVQQFGVKGAFGYIKVNLNF